MTQAVNLAVLGNGPAFSAYLSANQTVPSNTFTKVALNTKEFDTNSCFDTTLSRFTPTTAGYYQVNGMVSGGGSSIIIASIYKNGVNYLQGVDIRTTGNGYGSNAIALVFLNGTTDYLELYAYSTTTTISGGATAGGCRFSAAMVRGA